ncbi:MAG: hypothetical protein ABI675_17345 [Chitinophagaceae bacterium]
MPTPFKIAITKEIIAHCKNCGTGNDDQRVENNCAIAVALMNIFPKVHVTNLCIFPFGIDGDKEQDLKIPMPLIAQQFIKLFDGFRLTPKLRLLLPAFEFTIDIPDEVIEQINIDEVRELIKAGRTGCNKANVINNNHSLPEANLI